VQVSGSAHPIETCPYGSRVAWRRQPTPVALWRWWGTRNGHPFHEVFPPPAAWLLPNPGLRSPSRPTRPIHFHETGRNRIPASIAALPSVLQAATSSHSPRSDELHSRAGSTAVRPSASVHFPSPRHHARSLAASSLWLRTHDGLPLTFPPSPPRRAPAGPVQPARLSAAALAPVRPHLYPSSCHTRPHTSTLIAAAVRTAGLAPVQPVRGWRRSGLEISFCLYVSRRGCVPKSAGTRLSGHWVFWRGVRREPTDSSLCCRT
jgi:hypothetical protein